MSELLTPANARAVPPVAGGCGDSQIYSCFNFRLASDLPLAELSVAAGDDARPLVVARLGAVPESLPGGGVPLDGLQVAGSQALLKLPGVARFLVTDGREIVIDPHPGVSDRQLRLFLLGSVLGILCHQRGPLLLHANAIVAGGAAFAFAGPSGAGKSTLAAAFQQRGYELLADDVCMVDIDPAGTPFAWPGIPRLKLWADAARQFGHDCSALDRVSDDVDKYHVPARRRVDTRAVPFQRLYLLAGREDDGAQDPVRLRGQEAMAAVMAHTYRGFCLETMGLLPRHFRQCSALLSSIAVYAAPRRWGFEWFDREVDRLARHLLEEDQE